MSKKDKHLSVINFAKLAGVGRQAIYQKLRLGELVKMPNGKMNIDDPVNQVYLSLDRSQAKSNGDKNKKNNSVPALPVNMSLSEIENTLESIPRSKASAVLIKEVENIKKLQIHNAKQLEMLIDRDLVKKYFGDMSSIIINYIFPLGNRLAPRVAGICKVTDSKEVLKIQTIIDKEVMRALDQFKKACEVIDE
jgi:hypothetical protein